MKRILIIDDEEEICRMLETLLSLQGFEVSWTNDPSRALSLIKQKDPSCVVLDMMMPGEDGMSVLAKIKAADKTLPVIMLTACDQLKSAVAAMKAGAYHYLTKPFDSDELALVLNRAVMQRDLVAEMRSLKERFGETEDLDSLFGSSPAMRETSHALRNVAPTNINVLITGEPGTGKEIAARAIHHISGRKTGPYVSVDCAALSEELSQDVLFGRPESANLKAIEGKIQSADGGTLFLDSVDSLSPATQAKLARFAETGRIERENGSIAASVRIIAAAHTTPKGMSNKLNEFRLRIPPLRERREDIPSISSRLAKIAASEMETNPKTFSPEAMELLTRHDFPGNIRELKNIVKRAVVLAQDVIHPEHLPADIADGLRGGIRDMRLALPKGVPLKEASKMALQEIEALWIREALKKTSGRYGKAAILLGITPRTLYTKMKELSIEEPEDGRNT